MYLPEHVSPVLPDSRPDGAVCTCVNQRVACPRHEPNTYADHYARHATDSVAPLAWMEWAR